MDTDLLNHIHSRSHTHKLTLSHSLTHSISLSHTDSHTHSHTNSLSLSLFPTPRFAARRRPRHRRFSQRRPSRHSSLPTSRSLLSLSLSVSLALSHSLSLPLPTSLSLSPIPRFAARRQPRQRRFSQRRPSTHSSLPTSRSPSLSRSHSHTHTHTHTLQYPGSRRVDILSGGDPVKGSRARARACRPPEVPRRVAGLTAKYVGN